jgi:hypothetical protein
MRKNITENIHRYFFEGSDVPLAPAEKILKETYETIFTMWLHDPAMSDAKMRNFIIKKFKVSERLAYMYIHRVKLMLGNVTNAKKEWQRYMALEMIKKAYELLNSNLVKEIAVKRAMVMIKAAEAIGKITKLDKEDPDVIPWDEIIPLNIEPTGDVTVLGMKRMENLKAFQDRMRRKLGLLAEDAKVLPKDGH